MRPRLLLAVVVAGTAVSLAPAASANHCHHLSRVCTVLEGVTSAMDCHNIQSVCTAINELVGH